MVVFRVRMRLDAARHSQVVRSLLRILEPTRATPGCISCRLYADIEDSGVLLFVEEWIDEQVLMSHMQTDCTKVLLSALEYASHPPEVWIHTATDQKGLEWIAMCRESESPA